MKRFMLPLVIAVSAAFAFTACTVNSRSLKTPNHHLEFKKEDFEFSKQLTGEATQVKILMIDFARIFQKDLGEFEEGGQLNIPIIGGLIAKQVNMLALYNVIKDNPGYDVAFFPQYETSKTGIPILFTTTKVKVTVRLGKLK
jgi:hypothetical protein